MQHSSGIQVDEELEGAFHSLTHDSKELLYAVLDTQREVFVRTSGPPESPSCFLVLRHSPPPEVTAVIPESAHVKSRMIFASSIEGIRQQLSVATAPKVVSSFDYDEKLKQSEGEEANDPHTRVESPTLGECVTTVRGSGAMGLPLVISPAAREALQVIPTDEYYTLCVERSTEQIVCLSASDSKYEGACWFVRRSSNGIVHVFSYNHPSASVAEKMILASATQMLRSFLGDGQSVPHSTVETLTERDEAWDGIEAEKEVMQNGAPHSRFSRPKRPGQGRARLLK